MASLTLLKVWSFLFLCSIPRSDGARELLYDSPPQNMRNANHYLRSPSMNQLKYSPSGDLTEPNASVQRRKMQSDVENTVESSFRHHSSNIMRALPPDPHLRKASRNIHPWIESRSSNDVAQPRGLFERRSIFSSGMFNRPMLSNWNERVRNSFSNVFASILPSRGFQTPQATSSSAFFVPFNQPQYYAAGNPSVNFPMLSHQQFVGMPPNQVGAASYGQPHFVPFQSNLNAFPGLMPSGSTLMPQRFLPPVNHNFMNYAKSVPKHTPLFNNAGGLKGAAMEINNAFADFTDSHEHGPEVTQKFGSVGHTMSTFLNMMGLGPAGGITDDIGALGRGGDWASMENTPIARSSFDFYPGYGNQANLDDINDYPVFMQDITEQFLIKMNLTDVLNKVKEEKASKSNHIGENINPKKETEKLPNPEVALSGPKNTKLHTNIAVAELKAPVMSSGPAPIPKTITETKMAMPDEKEQMHDRKNLNASLVDKKEYMMEMIVIQPLNNPTNTTDKKDTLTIDTPSINYKIPSVFRAVSPKDRKKPIAVYIKNAPEFPHEKSSKISEEVDYAPAHPLPTHEYQVNNLESGVNNHEYEVNNHESEVNANRLINENVLRQWISMTEGKNYVEKHPKPIIDLEVEKPKSLTLLKEILSDSNFRPM